MVPIAGIGLELSSRGHDSDNLERGLRFEEEKPDRSPYTGSPHARDG